MLFDLRGRGRRRTVQVIYLTLAILMGGGLVLFGIGGDVQGGLFDAFSENRGDGSDQIREQVQTQEERTRTNPRDPAAWAALAQSRYQLASTGESYDQTTGQFTGEGQTVLRQAGQAWQRHVELAGDRPNADVAAVMTNAYEALGDPAQAARAWSLVVDAREEPGSGDFARLAQLYYQATNTRQGDLAARAAVRAAPRDQRTQLRQQLDQVKAQVLTQQAQGAAGGAAPAAPGTTP
jgi:hypothetical protein